MFVSLDLKNKNKNKTSSFRFEWNYVISFDRVGNVVQLIIFASPQY